jgi:hypothetical protein
LQYRCTHLKKQVWYKFHPNEHWWSQCKFELHNKHHYFLISWNSQ